MTHRFKTLSAPLLGLLVLVVAVPFGGCEAFEPPRSPVGDTAVLFSLARPDFIGEPSGFDFFAPRPVVVERQRGPLEEAANFDVAFSELDGAFVLLPAGLFESLDVNAGIVEAETGARFESLETAPSEGYVTDAPLVIREGGLYVVRTRQQRACARFAKMEVLELDPDGILEFRYLRNNLCNDRTLTDPDDD